MKESYDIKYFVIRLRKRKNIRNFAAKFEFYIFNKV